MKTLYLGTSEFAATVLRRLARSAHSPVLVITPPDARSGRGRKLHPPPVAEAAGELGLDLLQAADVNDDSTRARIAAAGAEIGAVCAFGQLIRTELLDELEFLNLHPSLLPRWRGAAPIERAILAGDEETGVTIMRLTEGLDSGPVALTEAVAVDRRGFGELSAELAMLGGELLVGALDRRACGGLEFAEQDDSLATYAEKIDSAERRLDPDHPAVELERRVRALNPHVGTYLELADGERLGVRAAAVGEADGGIAISCGEGTLRLLEVQPPGGRAMSAADYLRGRSVPVVKR